MRIAEMIVEALQRFIDFMIKSIKGQIDFITTVAPLVGRISFLISPFILGSWIGFLFSKLGGGSILGSMLFLLVCGHAYNKETSSDNRIPLGVIISFVIVDIILIYLIYASGLWLEHTDAGNTFHFEKLIPKFYQSQQ